jgi:phenylacetate-coenzyme A ligase PaaK-like adenylate-forming protein
VFILVNEADSGESDLNRVLAHAPGGFETRGGVEPKATHSLLETEAASVITALATVAEREATDGPSQSTAPTAEPLGNTTTGQLPTGPLVDLDRRLAAAQPERYDIEMVAPEVLSAMYQVWSSAGTFFAQSRNAVRDRLLDLTVRQARQQTDFYAQRFAGLGDEVVDKQSLSALGVLRRNDVEAAGREITSKYAEYAFSSYTTGTTRGIPLTIDRSAEEQRYLAKFMALVNDAPSPPAVALILASWHHGQGLRISGSTIGLPVFLANEIGFIQARTLLKRSYKVGREELRISAIAGTPNRLMQLTAFLAADGCEDVAASVQALQTTGRHVTTHARDWLLRFWNRATLTDRYSLTELFFSAIRCKICDRFHFDDFGHAEVVALDSNGSRSATRGELLLTGLYPFTQMTPLIRYATGDLAEVVDGSHCPSGQQGFRLLGRAHAVLPLQLGEDRPFVGSSEVYDALDGVADVARVPIPPYPLEAPKAPIPGWCHAAGAFPRFSMTNAETGPVIDVELRYAPAAFPDRAVSVRRQIEQALVEHCTVIRSPADVTVMLRPPHDTVDRAQGHRP